MRIRSRVAAVATSVTLALTAGLTAGPPAAAGVASGTDGWTSTGTTFTSPANGRVKVLDLWHVPRRRTDRVVIALRGPEPDWRTGYASEFHYEGSGDPIPIRGRSGLWISLSADGHTAAGENLYLGPRLARPRGETLKALALGGDFEGQVTFAFALRHRAAYRIKHVDSPSRLVIDFRHRR